ncbi:hypothetical protein EDB83DRAFT_2395960 [Lactarius deliciosus]|nr:hypothetical protein EDB83DRAFT_2395960 [Lactarius deliciosus]
MTITLLCVVVDMRFPVEALKLVRECVVEVAAGTGARLGCGTEVSVERGKKPRMPWSPGEFLSVLSPASSLPHRSSLPLPCRKPMNYPITSTPVKEADITLLPPPLQYRRGVNATCAQP